MTAAQGRVLDALRLITADGWPASVREIVRATGLASTATVHRHLKVLEAEGLVETNPGRRVGWRPTPDPE